ncbi:uncharacterized protein LOC129235385 [Anastrepha obliqua]|uniref:uncharacterized protein LOC129235385 n=1 Tax=Anastrepha obliqua TaxID=95512 RepID=UPI00240964F1|nr:uncharacterized protein LOC129235385 [Anastrepha obliqua]
MLHVAYSHRVAGLLCLAMRLMQLHALPAQPNIANLTASEIGHITAVDQNNNYANHTLPSQEPELEAAASENGPPSAETIPSNVANSSNGSIDPSVFANYFTPEAIRHYINQFGATYPGYPAYPAPIGYVAAPQPPPPGVGPIYPGPYVVQTGYEGYLVPATTAISEAASNPHNNNSNALLRPLTYLINLFSMMMMSSLFRVVATIIGAIGVFFFSGTLSRFVCAFTPMCEITNSAVEYLRNDTNVTRVARMIAEGMTPEGVQRAAEHVQTAIRKYEELQKLIGSEERN